ncbi:MAG TPA: hypothetical protein VFF18_03385 [Woeseiaceae bacterium]|nr:hypothetical protein [Woeseiaceae bacterium]
MKLTQREIELLSKIPAERAKRRRNLLLGFALYLVVPVIGLYVDLDFDSRYDLTDVYSVLGGFLLGQWAWYLRSRPEDKLIEVVQRYVNRDPEAIREFAARGRADS